MSTAMRLSLLPFAAGIAFLGGQQIVLHDFIRGGPFMAPAWLPARTLLALLSGLILAGAATGLVAAREIRRPAAALTAMLALFLLAFHLTAPLPMILKGAARTRALETLSFAGFGLFLAGRPNTGRLVFAAALVVFGAQHFMYARSIASTIPSWIPGPLQWTYVTGAALILAGLCLATGILVRTAAAGLAIMFLSWVVIIHARDVVANVHDASAWNDVAVVLAMAGVSLVLAIAAPRGIESTAASS